MEISILDLWSVVGLIADILILAVLILSLIRGGQKGFVYCVVWLASIVAAVIGARLATALFEEPITEFIYTKSEKHILEATENAALELDSIDWDDLDFSPGREERLTEEEYAVLMKNEGLAKVDKVMGSVGISESSRRERFYSIARSIHTSSENASTHIARMSTEVVHKAIRLLVRVLLIVIVFLVVLLLLRLLGEGLSKLFEKIPVVGSLDKILGVVFSFLSIFLIILVLLYAWQHIWPDSFNRFTAGAPVTAFLAKHSLLISFFGE